MRRSKGAYLFDDLVGIRGAKRYGTFGRVRPSHHCALMLAARTTLPHFSVSSAMSLPKSAGEPAIAMPPSPTKRAFIVASARPALTSLFNFSTISAGVFLGAPMPYQELASKPGKNSATVGTSASASERFVVVT